MAGKVLRIMPLQSINWQGSVASGTPTWMIANYIDVSAWKEATLVVRIHPGTVINGSNTISASYYAFDPAIDDPSNDFQAGLVASVSFSASSAVPSMAMVPIPNNFGLFGRLVINGLLVNTSASALAWMSADLVLKTDG